MLTASLLAAALLAGLAGAWSPCGFSMVESIAPDASNGRVRGTIAAAVAFAAGAAVGGIATFAGLALAGRELGSGGGLAGSVAAGLLLAAAAGDVAGRRIVPQVRRQVPESWRRRLPLPLAAGAYGVLLGLGFTTFVLSFATYALAAACLALAEPAVGAAVGLAFAAGRAIPVLLLAPWVQRPWGERIATAMAESPAILRGLRAAAAVTLAAGGIALAAGEPVAALAAAAPLRATRFAEGATDPGAADGAVVWQAAGRGGRIWRAGRTEELPGDSPAVGGGWVAWRSAGRIEVAALGDLAVRSSFEAPGADEIAVSADWLAWRESDPALGSPRIRVTDRAGTAAPRNAHVLSAHDGQLGRPALDGTVLAFHVATPRSCRIVEIDLATGSERQLVAPRGTLLLQPSIRGDGIALVRATARRQELVVTSRTGDRERLLWSTVPTARRDAGVEPGRHRHRAGYPRRRPRPLWPRPRPGHVATLWTTAVTDDAAYVTRLLHRGGTAVADLLVVEGTGGAGERRRHEEWVTS